MMKKLLAVVICMVLVLGIAWGYRARYRIEWMDREINPSELYGKWVLSEKSKRSLRGYGHSEQLLDEGYNHLILSEGLATGKITLFHGLRKEFPTYTIETSWSIAVEKEGERYRHKLHFAEGNLVVYEFRVSEIDGKIAIWNYIYDPGNTHDLYVFERSESESKALDE